METGRKSQGGKETKSHPFTEGRSALPGSATPAKARGAWTALRPRPSSAVNRLASLVEDELLRVDQGPQDVLVGQLLRVGLGVLLDVLQGRLQLLGRGLAGEHPQEQLLHLLGVRTLVRRQLVG